MTPLPEPRPGEEPPWVRDWLEKAMSEIQLRDWEKEGDPDAPEYHDGCSDACEYKQPERLAVAVRAVRAAERSRWVTIFALGVTAAIVLSQVVQYLFC